ncbi:MAG: hypothetical protein NTW32_20355, partial [Chloroflexi bacterium]|nr:hypothetical protein [Chloroflexota bacterium]
MPAPDPEIEFFSLFASRNYLITSIAHLLWLLAMKPAVVLKDSLPQGLKSYEHQCYSYSIKNNDT